MLFEASTASHHAHRARLLLGIVLVLGGLISLVLPSISSRGTLTATKLASLRASRRDAELSYARMVDKRVAFVQKWGPSPEQVDPFPQGRGYYTMWDFFLPHPASCPWDVESVGALGDGHKYVCGLTRLQDQKNCVVYSAGINGESSFEAELLTRAPYCRVYGYDFTVSSMGPEVANVPDLAARSHFMPIKLSAHNNHSSTPPEWTLAALMEQNGHDWIDVLKIDIEGDEVPVLNALLDAFDVLPVGQLQLEIHATQDGAIGTFSPFLRWWEKLENAGLRPFAREANLVYVSVAHASEARLVEYSFINVRSPRFATLL